VSGRRALLSVTDKSGLLELARSLIAHGYELIASGGTAQALRQAEVPVTEVEAITGQPEILGGRVKTLHPALHAGILAKTAADLAPTGFAPIDVVVVNLYDLAAKLAESADESARIEAIDIGGPTLLRAAAKNFQRVTVLSSPQHYAEFVRELDRSEGPSLEFRRRMAREVFQLTRQTDELIAERIFAAPTERHVLRYGENPHQAAWWSAPNGLAGLGLSLHGGKELSYNNLLDAVATLKLGIDLPEDACVIVKHTNPCGVGRGATPIAAFERALAGDPTSAFGGIVGFGRPVDAAAAEALAQRFFEVVLAPSYGAPARELLRGKKNLRWLSVELKRFAAATRGSERRHGALRLVQDEDEGFGELARWQLAAGPTPPADALAAAELAWRVAKHVKSNAIVLADAQGTLGIGAGQMSRIDSSRLAIQKASALHSIQGCAAASDGFFPFADGVEELAAAGIRTIVQPGGSIRDDEVIAAADRLGISLLLTGVRHFRH
jgi:phosphoribosylaminoimidazolecarboxamide formyltransferase/IMP cyclohydrolase